MTERRFLELEDALIRRGVAMRHARRASVELEAHFRQLVEEAVAHGEPSEEALRAAHQVLGTDQAVIEHYAGRRELRGWSYRRPVLYALAPLAGFAVLCTATMTVLVVTLRTLNGLLHHFVAPPWVAEAVNSLVGMTLQWMLPMVVAGGFALLARRRRIGLGWLIAGTLLVCLLGQQINVGLMLPTVGHGGNASMGIGFAWVTLPDHLARAIGMVGLALAPYFVATYLSRPDRTPLP